MKHPTLRIALLATGLLTAGGMGAAFAQRATLYDPAQLPAIKGKVTQYDLTPRGDVDGLLLDDGTQVHFPPHLGTEIVAVIKPGDAVTVHGLKARALPLVQAMSVTADASGKTVQDDGPPGGPHGMRPPGGPGGPGPMGHGPGGPGGPGPMGHGLMGRGEPMTAQGTVKAALYGPRGDVNGVLLDNGTIVRLPPPEAARLGDQLKAGQTVAVRGHGFSNNLGTVVMARAIGPSADKLTELKPPPGPGPDARGPGAPPPPAR